MRKFLAFVAVLVMCLTFAGCAFLGTGEDAPVRATVRVDSDPAPVLRIGGTYKLIYTADRAVTVTVQGNIGTFDEAESVFTATHAGDGALVLQAGEGDTMSEVRVNVTVLTAGDKTELLLLMERAKAYSEADYAGYDALQRELEFASAIAADPGATTGEVEGAVSALQAAIDGLSPRDFSSRKATVTADRIAYEGEYYLRSHYENFAEVTAAVLAVNADGTLTFYSAYDAAVRAALAKLIPTGGDNMASIDFEHGIQMAETVYGHYLSRTVVYNVIDANGNHASGSDAVTDFWSLTSLLALMVRLDSVTEASYKAEVDAVIKAMSYYCGQRSDNTAGEGGKPRNFDVYAVHRGWFAGFANVYGDHGEESVFDDQIWAAQEFLNAYLLYGEKSYLDRAVELTEYIYLVGNDPYLGGIYWGQAYTSRHSCSNAPFVKLAAMLADATGEAKYLDWAKNIYAFAYEVLRDPSDDLYCDLVRTRYEDERTIWEGGKSVANDGLDYTKYSYNSGAMISAGVALYRATGEKHYLEEAQATAASCREHFGDRTVRAGYNVYPGSDGNTTYSWFNLILFKGYLDLFGVDPAAGRYLDEVQAVVDYDCSHFMRDGFIPTTGLVGWAASGRNSFGERVLMDHVTNADTLLLLGQYHKQKG